MTRDNQLIFEAYKIGSNLHIGNKVILLKNTKIYLPPHGIIDVGGKIVTITNIHDCCNFPRSSYVLIDFDTGKLKFDHVGANLIDYNKTALLRNNVKPEDMQTGSDLLDI
jgi:hypothetical protein